MCFSSASISLWLRHSPVAISRLTRGKSTGSLSLQGYQVGGTYFHKEDILEGKGTQVSKVRRSSGEELWDPLVLSLQADKEALERKIHIQPLEGRAGGSQKDICS